jgi:inner membrane protein
MPSPIAHAVSGYAILRLWPDAVSPYLKQIPRWLPFYGVLVAVMPDLDFVPQILTGDRYHHGFTHSITLAVGVALVTWGIATYIARHRQSWQLGLLTLALYSSHLVLDLITQDSSGIQLLWPFSPKFYQSSLTIFPSTYWSEPLLQHPGHFIFIAFELGYTLLIIGIVWFIKKKR